VGGGRRQAWQGAPLDLGTVSEVVLLSLESPDRQRSKSSATMVEERRKLEE